MAAPAEPPPALRAALRGETPDFVVSAARVVPRREALVKLAIGIPLALAILVAGQGMARELAGGGAVIEVDGEERVATLDDPALLLIVAVMVVFGAGGALVAARGWLELRRPGPWWAATPTRLVAVSPRATREWRWDELAAVRVQPDHGTVTLRIVQAPAFDPLGRRGHGSSAEGAVLDLVVGRDRPRGRFDHPEVVLAHVEDADAVAAACRRRVEEASTPHRGGGVAGAGGAGASGSARA